MLGSEVAWDSLMAEIASMRQSSVTASSAARAQERLVISCGHRSRAQGCDMPNVFYEVFALSFGNR